MISVGPNLNLQKAQLNYKPKPVKHGRMYQILIYSGLVSRLSGFELKKESENPTKGFVSLSGLDLFFYKSHKLHCRHFEFEASSSSSSSSVWVSFS